MVVVVLSVGIMLAVVAIMSVGVLLGREPIKGSCGGMSALGMKTACDICGGTDRCEKEIAEAQVPADKLAYNAAESSRKN